MSRFAVGTTTGAGSTTLPIFSIYAAATGRPYLTELAVFNTTATAVALRLVRLSTTGTRGAAVTVAQLSQEDPATATATAYNTHTVAPTIASDLGYRTILGASVGSGVIWTWPDRVLTLTASATNGIGLIVESGTGQACSVYAEFGE